MIYSKDLQIAIESVKQVKDSFLSMSDASAYLLDSVKEIANEITEMSTISVENLDADIDNSKKIANNYVDYLKQNNIEENKNTEVNNKNETIDERNNLYDDLKKRLSIDITESEKDQLKKINEDIAETQRRINSYSATQEDFQKNADLNEKYHELSQKVFGAKLQEEELRLKFKYEDSKRKLEEAKKYSETSKQWASMLDQLQEDVVKSQNDYKKLQNSSNYELEEYSANDLANLIKEAELKARSTYQYDKATELGRAFYNVKNKYGNYQLDLRAGTEKITVFGDRSIEDFIDKLKSIGLIN